MAGLLDAPKPEALASLLTAANLSVLFFPCFISIFSLEPIESCSTQSPFRNIECSEKPVKYFCLLLFSAGLEGSPSAAMNFLREEVILEKIHQ